MYPPYIFHSSKIHIACDMQPWRGSKSGAANFPGMNTIPPLFSILAKLILHVTCNHGVEASLGHAACFVEVGIDGCAQKLREGCQLHHRD